MALPDRPSRRELEKRAYTLTLGTIGAGVATVVLLVLAAVGVTSFGLAFLVALVTLALGYGLKRTVTRR